VRKYVRILDEAERVQSVSYSHIRSLSGLYAVACLREGKRGTCVRSPFAAVMCKVAYLASKGAQQQLQCIIELLCFQRGPQQRLQCANTLLSKGPKVTVMHFTFKGPPNFTDFYSASYFNLRDRSFLRGVKWWPDWNFGPLWQRGPSQLGSTECGRYGSWATDEKPTYNTVSKQHTDQHRRWEKKYSTAYNATRKRHVKPGSATETISKNMFCLKICSVQKCVLPKKCVLPIKYVLSKNMTCPTLSWTLSLSFSTLFLNVG